jgi:hypothetical protein
MSMCHQEKASTQILSSSSTLTLASSPIPSLARHSICYTVLIPFPISSLLKHSRNRIGELYICSRNERRRKIEATLVSPGLPFLILFCKVQRNNMLLLTWDWKVVHPRAYIHSTTQLSLRPHLKRLDTAPHNSISSQLFVKLLHVSWFVSFPCSPSGFHKLVRPGNAQVVSSISRMRPPISVANV